MGEKDKQRSTNSVIRSHGDVEYSIGDILNNIIITMCGISWVLNLSGSRLTTLHVI